MSKADLRFFFQGLFQVTQKVKKQKVIFVTCPVPACSKVTTAGTWNGQKATTN